MFTEILENNQFFGLLGSITLSGSWPKMEPMGRNFLQLLQYMLSSTVAPRAKGGGGGGGNGAHGGSYHVTKTCTSTLVFQETMISSSEATSKQETDPSFITK